MGMNAITCRGYADVKESGLGKGNRTASDLDGNDRLKGVALMALLAAGTFVAGCVGKDEPPKLEQPKLEQQYRFNRFGDTKTIHDEGTNKTYALEFNGLEKLHKEWGYGIYKEAHFTVYDVGAQGKMKIGDIGIVDVSGQDITLPGTRMNLDVDIGKGYVDLKITEQ